VLFYPGADKTNGQLPADVHRVGRLGRLCLSVQLPSRYNLSIRDGVPHIDDADAKNPERVESGGWDHTPATKLLMDLACAKQAAKPQQPR
jgi:hypothetical protein